MNPKQMMIKAMVQGAYDCQKLRIQSGLRIVGAFKKKLGQDPPKKEEDLEEEAKKFIKDLRRRYRRISDAMVEQSTKDRAKNFKGDELISSYSEYCLMRCYEELLENEEQAFIDIGKAMDGIPIWDEFLKGIKGIGPAMGGVIVSCLDPTIADHVSAFWKYAGLDVGPDGAGRSKRKAHLIQKEYTNKDGELEMRDSITFNPWLKTKLVGVLAGGFLKVKESPYKDAYYNYKHRLENHERYGIHNDGQKDEKLGGFFGKKRRHSMALRYCVKLFLADLWAAWRKLEGLSVSEPYHVAKLGMPQHGETAKV